jgi:PEP-CTERM motif-containing protein
MRKSLWIVPIALLIVSICAPAARADTITTGIIHFTLSNGTPAPTGSFVLDNTTDVFSSFAVNWDGAVFNVFYSVVAGFDPVSLVSYLSTSGTWCAVGPGNFVPYYCLGNSEGFFFCGPVHCEFDINNITGTFNPGDANANGTYTVTETVVTTPEPSSVGLLLAGIGLVLVMRKRIGRGLPQAT